jgi:hypothetical protein
MDSKEYVQDTPKDHNELSEVRRHLNDYYSMKHKQHKDNVFKDYMTTNEPSKKSTTDVINQQYIDEKRIKPIRSQVVEKPKLPKEIETKQEHVPETRNNKYDMIDDFISYAQSPTINQPVISRGGYNFKDIRSTPIKVQHDPNIDNFVYTPKHISYQQTKPSEEKEPYYINTNTYNNNKKPADGGNKRLNDLHSIKELVSNIDNILKNENVQKPRIDYSQINTQKYITKKEQLDERYKDGPYVINNDPDYYDYLNKNSKSVIRTNNLFNNLKENKDISPLLHRKEAPNDVSYLKDHSFRKIIDHDDDHKPNVTKSTNYDNEYVRIKSKIDNRNDKLKLDDKARDYAINKLNDFQSPSYQIEQSCNPVGIYN